jgi:glycosyltransferase involved in cell wall biosynthesis
LAAIDAVASVAARAAANAAGLFASRANPASLRVPAGVKELELDLIEARRRVRGLEETIRRGEPPPELEEVGSTPARAAPAPRVSVICALYNDAGHVDAALASLAAQAYADWELVVADDGSTDGSGEAVEAFMASHPSAPALLVRHPVNRGLPAARNAAISRARGEYVLVLDSDNELYPHCLERLVEALDAAPDAAFAYGILEQFDRSGPVGLSGYFGWEPERLVEGNYIDALALLRRSALEELGGFTEDRRLYGWEDYDLWCRIAERGDRAAHVPEIVARYRLAAGSMISLTNLSIREASEALAERSPRLFERVDFDELEPALAARGTAIAVQERLSRTP